MKVELILILVIGLVFLVDFLSKGMKKTKNSNEVTKKNENEIKNDFSKNVNGYILSRKKNISLSLIFICVLKVSIHYFFYNEDHQFDVFKTEIGWYINGIFNEKVWLLIPSIILVVFIAWYFNDKIKAR